MRTFALFLILLLSGCYLSTLHAEETDKTPGTIPVTVNFGAKAGFTAALSLINDFTINGIEVEQVQNNYKVGYFASLFMRINFGRHFLQPEVSYNVNSCEVSFNKPMTDDTALDIGNNERASISSQIHSFDIPVLYGYNFIKQGPYNMAVFGGPKIRLLWNYKSDITFRNFDDNYLEEELHHWGLSFTLGVAITISPIFFDFRYDIGLLNLSERISGGDVNYRRRDNVLSFSLGIFF